MAGFELLSTPGMREDEVGKSGCGSCPTETWTVIGETGKLDREGGADEYKADKSMMQDVDMDSFR